MIAVTLAACQQCGARFVRTRAKHRFCNNICRSKFHHEQREKALRIARELGANLDPHMWEKWTQKE